MSQNSRVLVKKMSAFGPLGVQLIGGSVLMAAAMIALPVGILWVDATLLANPYLLGVVLVGMLFFGLVGFFGCIRPYLLYRKMPSVLVEADSEFLYVHARKEAKIPLEKISEAYVHISLPYLYQKELVAVLLVHLFSEKYGTVILEIEGYGTVHIPFASNVHSAASELVKFLRETVENPASVGAEL